MDLGTMGEPGDRSNDTDPCIGGGGECVHVSNPKPKEPSDSECEESCGEAGCHNGACWCIYDNKLVKPDKDHRCPHKISNDIIGGKVDIDIPDLSPPCPSPPYPPNIGNGTLFDQDCDKNESSLMPLVSTTNGSDNIHLQVIKIAVPVVGLLVLALTISFCLYRRRKSVHNRVPKTESPISWLHRQDSIMLLENMTILSKNPNYYTPDFEASSLANLQTKQIAREKLRLLEEIGEGAFGKVYKGEVTWSAENVTFAAVKILKEGVSRETREDFKREVEIMSAFDHENILRLLGIVCIEAESPYMIFEFMEHGDLADLLRRNDPLMAKERRIELKQTDLVDIAVQVSNGMMYLTSQHFVHRDLATRNCLVGAELIVKISDFGMSRDIYTCDYYRIGGSRMLPVRWMSPESVKYGRFTTESDVWAYGVVLWEIFSYGKQPYYGHSNEEVIRFIEDGILLQKPEECPSTIFHVMLGCWRTAPKDRFTFERIHGHLVDYGRKMVKCYHTVHMHDIAEYEDITV